MSTFIPVEPPAGIDGNLGNVDQTLNAIQGRQPTDITVAGASMAQVYATCALVHAVRELTQAVRDLKEGR